jgi:hypothetical protein
MKGDAQSFEVGVRDDAVTIREPAEDGRVQWVHAMLPSWIRSKGKRR